MYIGIPFWYSLLVFPIGIPEIICSYYYLFIIVIYNNNILTYNICS